MTTDFTWAAYGILIPLVLIAGFILVSAIVQTICEEIVNRRLMK